MTIFTVGQSVNLHASAWSTLPMISEGMNQSLNMIPEEE